jgi:hypothetical protein
MRLVDAVGANGLRTRDKRGDGALHRVGNELEISSTGGGGHNARINAAVEAKRNLLKKRRFVGRNDRLRRHGSERSLR